MLSFRLSGSARRLRHKLEPHLALRSNLPLASNLVLFGTISKDGAAPFSMRDNATCLAATDMTTAYRRIPPFRLIPCLYDDRKTHQLNRSHPDCLEMHTPGLDWYVEVSTSLETII